MATRKTVPAAAKALAKGGLLAKISSFVRFGPFTRESKLGLGVVAAVLVLYAAYLWFLQQSGKKKAAPKAKAAAAKPPASPKRAKSPAAKKAPAAAAASSSPAAAKSSSPPSGTRRTRSKTPSKKTK